MSLFENNVSIQEINVYLLNDDIRKDNLEKISALCKHYSRNLILVDTKEILNTLKDLGVEPFRGTFTTYFKLLAIGKIRTSTNRLLQLDGDTIINESLADLFDVNLEDMVCGATYECVQNEYKDLIGLNRNEKYYNCGVLWINQDNWRKLECEKKIFHHLATVRSRYFTVDQDIINVLFREKITYIDIKYNLNSGFYIYGIPGSFYIYDLDPSYYVTQNDVKAAMAKPYINHCMGPMTGRPWEQDNFHPQNDLYNHYLSRSPWKDTPKILAKRSRLFNLQKTMYIHFPRKLYCRIHKIFLKHYLKKMNANCLKTTNKC